jgi:hypothetical protein
VTHGLSSQLPAVLILADENGRELTVELSGWALEYYEEPPSVPVIRGTVRRLPGV